MRSRRNLIQLFLFLPLLGACTDPAPTEPTPLRPAAAKVPMEYDLVDLGIAGGVRAEATDINIHGVIVGWSEDAQGRRRPFRARVSRSGEILIESLAVPDHCSSAQVDEINDRGLAAGSSSGDPNAGCGDSLGWDDVGVPGPLFQAGCKGKGDQVVDVNNHGIAVVSVYNGSTGQLLSCFGRAGGRSATIDWGDGTAVDALNDQGVAVGWATFASSAMRRPVAIDLRCAERPACRRMLPVPPGATGDAADINDRGQIIGNVVLANGTRRGWGWDLNNDGTFSSFDLGDTGTHEINSGGVVAGVSDFGSGPRATVLHLGSRTRIPLPVPAGSMGSAATAINDRNEVVGWFYYEGTQRSALWRPIK